MKCTRLAAAWRQYNTATISHPKATATCTGCLLSGAADLTAQVLERSPLLPDARRAAAMAFFGGFLSGLPSLVAFRFYARCAPVGRHGRVRSAVLACLLDGGLYAPLWLLPCYFVCTGFLRGDLPMDIIHNMGEHFAGAWRSYLQFWLPANAINFYAVPLRLRVLYAMSASYGHKVLLSWQTNGRTVA